MAQWFWESLLSGVWAAGLLAVAAYLGRTWIKARVEYAVKGVYDAQLANLNSQLRQSEAQITALQQHALGPIATKNNIVSQRRVEAVSTAWEAVHSLGKAKAAAMWISAFNYENAAKEAQKNPGLQEFFKTLDQHKDNALVPPEYQKAMVARPFMSPMAYALLTAYGTIVHFAVLQIKVIAFGWKPEYFSEEAVRTIIAAALPDKAEEAAQGGLARYQLLDEIERRLLAELEKQLTVTEQDADNAARAADILKAVTSANAKVPPA